MRKKQRKSSPRVSQMLGEQASLFVLPPFREGIMDGTILHEAPEAGYPNSPLISQAIGGIDSSPESQTGIDYFSCCWDEKDPVDNNVILSRILVADFDTNKAVLREAVVGTWYACTASFGNTIAYKLENGGKWRGRMSISGRGCAVLSEGRFRDLMAYLADKPNLSVTRIDVKADDRNGILCLDTIASHLSSGGYTGFRGGETIRSYGGKRAGTTVYFGGRKSEIRCRFYDKAAESGVEGAGVRQELQFRGKRAQQVFDHIIQEPLERICVYARSLLVGVMSLGERKGKNLDRFVPADFWIKWTESLGSIGRREPTVMRQTTVARSLEWLARAASKAVAKAHNVMGKDFPQFVEKMVEYGNTRMKHAEIEDVAVEQVEYEPSGFTPFYYSRMCYC